MATHYSKYFGVPHSAFEKKGVFDGYVDKDLKFHFDPLRLKNTSIPEFKGTYETVFLKYYERFVLFVDNIDYDEKTFFDLIVEHMQFPEISNVGLGYSEDGKPGRGMSGKVAREVATSIVKVIRAGMRDPELFMFMHLFEKNIGADRISDMAVHVMRKEILAYTQRIAQELSIAVYPFEYMDVVYQVPFYNNEPLHFLPEYLLRDLPVATSYDDIEGVCDYNRELKRKVCNAVKGEWKDYISSGNKQVVKSAIMGSRAAYDAAINYFRSLSVKAYDFTLDEKNAYFDARIEDIVNDKISQDKGTTKLTADEILAATREACMLYKECIENHRSYKLMYYEKGNVAKSEDYAQELLYVISEAYLRAKGFDIDVSPEADTGVGKLDFKFSQGRASRVIIETKLSDNDNLLHGYVSQLPDYMNSQNTDKSIYVVVEIDSPKNKISLMKRLHDIEDKRKSENSTDPEIIFVNARERVTASKKS